MNENARAWIAALRSGEYKQGRLALHQGDEFCCLGVACELYAKTNPIEITIKNTVTFYDEEESMLPTAVQEWLGLRDIGGVTFQGKALYTMNDTGDTFNTIASFIEVEPTGLFEEAA